MIISIRMGRIKVKGQFLWQLTDLFARAAIPPGLSAKERFPSFSPTGKIPTKPHFFLPIPCARILHI
jgi:hypothetical protein